MRAWPASAPEGVDDAIVFDLPSFGESTLTENTDKEPTAARERRIAALRRAPDPVDESTDELPRGVLLTLASRRGKPAPEADALPPISQAPAPAQALPPLAEDASTRATVEDPSRRAADEASTGLFESWEWDEADPIATGSFPSLESPVEPTPVGPTDGWIAPAPRDVIPIPEPPRPERPSLSVVRSVPPSEEDEALEGIRATPLPLPPRPGPIAAWPPPAARPLPEYPSDWLDADQPDTYAVVPRRASRANPLVVAAIDAGAWALGFAATFFAGLATAGGGVMVVIAVSLLGV